ncbi:MAG: DUF2948 family protein [Rhodobacteraceae bacterium]|nr:DUF2948 family protein [Paracoccaceae bacterium]
MPDALFEDASPTPLRLRACDGEDLKVIATLVQDAIFTRQEIQWHRKRREFSLLLSRMKWETQPDSADGCPDRVRSVLRIADVLELNLDELSADDVPEVFSVLDIAFTPGADGTGKLTAVLAGDFDITLRVECIEITLTDVELPYRAASGKLPDHG